MPFNSVNDHISIKNLQFWVVFYKRCKIAFRNCNKMNIKRRLLLLLTLIVTFMRKICHVNFWTLQRVSFYRRILLIIKSKIKVLTNNRAFAYHCLI